MTSSCPVKLSSRLEWTSDTKSTDAVGWQSAAWLCVQWVSNTVFTATTTTWTITAADAAAASHLEEFTIVRCPVWDLTGRWLSANVWRRSSSAAFCRLKDLCRQADLQQLWWPMFAADSPKLWNSLPACLGQTDIGHEQFRRLLKIYLFGRWHRGALWHSF